MYGDGKRRSAAVRHGLFAFALLSWAAATRADEVQLAVAANFAGPVEQIAAEFARETGHKAVVSIGSTGKFYAQIRNGAPFEILLAADQATPQKLQDDGLVGEGRRFTYAVGKLVLYSARPGYVDPDGKVLKKGAFQRLALANPQTAPYGAAGLEALKALGLWETVQGKVVQGDSIGQAFEFVASGNAELGFVALSQVAAPGKPASGSWWLVPATLYKPILQDAVLLKKGEGHPGALAFMDFLRSDKVKRLIQSYGYGS
jgi:molybdate transport system substrate-binding protein